VSAIIGNKDPADRSEIDKFGALTTPVFKQRYPRVDHPTRDPDELQASKQARIRAWKVLQRLRAVLVELGNTTIPPPKQKS
jgi:hypothetical protein